MKSHSIAIIINSGSGAGLGKRLFEELSTARLTDTSVHDISVLPTLDLKDFSHVVVCGGDGTITSVAGKMVRSGATGVVVPAPLGTANDLAREVGVGRVRHAGSILSILDNLKNLNVRPITVWEARWGQGESECIFFTNYFSLGFDAKVVEEFTAWRSNRKGKPSSVLHNRAQYAWRGFQNLTYRLPFLSIRHESGAISMQGGSSIIFANIRSIMGFGRTHPKCDFSDDLLEGISIPNPLSFLRLMPPCNYLLGPPELLGRHKAWKISGNCSGLPAQVDGELLVLGPVETIEVKVAGSTSIGGHRQKPIS